MTDLFGQQSKAEIKAQRRRKYRAGQWRKKKLMDVFCAWKGLRARVYAQSLERNRALPRTTPKPPEYETWSEGQRCRFWFAVRQQRDAIYRWFKDDDAFLAAELARADRAYAKRKVAIDREYKRAITV